MVTEMANLYEIDQGILGCLDLETGEVIDPERLESLQMERDQKIENVACWVKNLLSDADAIKAEKEALADREAKCRKKAEDLKKWLGMALEGQKFTTARCAVSFRRSEQVEVEDVALIPAELLRVKTAVEADKTAIKAAIKEGKEVNGCHLVERQSVQIK
jgi:hypothetical protein